MSNRILVVEQDHPPFNKNDWTDDGQKYHMVLRKTDTTNVYKIDHLTIGMLNDLVTLSKMRSSPTIDGRFGTANLSEADIVVLAMMR